jgi:hypothetical protein
MGVRGWFDLKKCLYLAQPSPAWLHLVAFRSARHKYIKLVYCSRVKAAIMCLHAICCHIHEFCCNWLHGVTEVVTGSWHIFMGARSVSWTRRVSVAKELGNKMFMSAHVNDIRLQPLYTWMLHALTRYTKFAVIYKKTTKAKTRRISVLFSSSTKWP